MTTVVIVDAAEEQLGEIVEWWAAHREASPLLVTQEFDRCVSLLEASPDVGVRFLRGRHRAAHADRARQHPDNVLGACALARVVVELDKDEPDGIRFVRLEGDKPWLLRREDPRSATGTVDLDP